MTHQDSDGAPMVRVLVVDDQQLMRDGLTTLLSMQPGLTVVGTAINGREAIEKVLTLQPDVVLMDVRMPIMDGVTAAAEVIRQAPACQVLMLTTFDDDEYISGALQVGARGYLLKDLPAHDLAQAIRAAHRGLYQFDPTVGGKITAGFVNSSTPQSAGSKEGMAAKVGVNLANLTERELAVLRLIAGGKTNREIAALLHITEGTVKSHVSNIIFRLDVRDRTQAALSAREQGLL